MQPQRRQSDERATPNHRSARRQAVSQRCAPTTGQNASLAPDSAAPVYGCRAGRRPSPPTLSPSLTILMTLSRTSLARSSASRKRRSAIPAVGRSEMRHAKDPRLPVGEGGPNKCGVAERRRREGGGSETLTSSEQARKQQPARPPALDDSRHRRRQTDDGDTSLLSTFGRHEPPFAGPRAAAPPPPRPHPPSRFPRPPLRDRRRAASSSRPSAGLPPPASPNPPSQPACPPARPARPATSTSLQLAALSYAAHGLAPLGSRAARVVSVGDLPQSPLRWVSLPASVRLPSSSG